MIRSGLVPQITSLTNTYLIEVDGIDLLSIHQISSHKAEATNMSAIKQLSRLDISKVSRSKVVTVLRKDN
jgi:hypothetical protein